MTLTRSRALAIGEHAAPIEADPPPLGIIEQPTLFHDRVMA